MTPSSTAPPLPRTSAEFSPSELSFFRENGYVIVRGLAEPSVWRTMTDCVQDHLARQVGPVEYEVDLHYPGAPSSRDARGGDTIRRLKEAHSRHPIFTEWVSSPGISGRLGQIFGTPVVMPLAHHNCVMTKQPHFSSETHWHQDIRYWSFERPELVSVWLALGSERPENGGLSLIPGSHSRSFSRERFDDRLFFREDLAENQRLIETRVNAELEAGDVLFFHCRTFHAAGRNRSDRPKFSVVFTFRPLDNPPLPNTRSSSMAELLLPRGG